MNKNFLLFLFSLFSFFGNAQDAPQMADALRENGKINVVITVIAIIFLALIAFLIYIERKVTKLENKLKDKNNQ